MNMEPLFDLCAPYQPTGDQPRAIEKLAQHQGLFK